MLERLQVIEDKYNELNDELMNPEVISNIKRTLEITKEQASLRDAYNIYQEYKKVLSDIESAKEMVKDPELGEFAKEELETLQIQKDAMEKDIEIILLPKDPNDGKNVIVEIRGAAGGDEGNIFAGDLYRMYTKYAEGEGWKIEEMEAEQEKIAQINAQAQLMQQRANQFLNNDAEAQKSQLEMAEQMVNQGAM